MSINSCSLPILISLCLFIPGFGQTEISGDLTAYSFVASKGPFIVKADIEVPKNKSVIINEGCVLQFESFTGLYVSGKLQVNGSPGHPVIFTSIKDRAAADQQQPSVASPFDWNGIMIMPAADTVRMNNFNVSYSIFGIIVQQRKIIVTNGTFRSNKQFHLSIDEVVQSVEENVPFSNTVAMPVKLAAVPPEIKGVKLITVPSGAEVYLNKQPGKRILRDAVTPARIKPDADSSATVTLFKKGYDNTTLVLDFSKKQPTLEIPLVALSPDKAALQKRFLRDRLHARIGAGCFVAAPLFITAGIISARYADRQRQSADEAASFLNKTLLPQSDIAYQEHLQDYNDAKAETNDSRTMAITAFAAGAAALGAGVTLFWFW